MLSVIACSEVDGRFRASGVIDSKLVAIREMCKKMNKKCVDITFV